MQMLQLQDLVLKVKDPLACILLLWIKKITQVMSEVMHFYFVMSQLALLATLWLKVTKVSGQPRMSKRVTSLETNLQLTIQATKDVTQEQLALPQLLVVVQLTLVLMHLRSITT